MGIVYSCICLENDGAYEICKLDSINHKVNLQAERYPNVLIEISNGHQCEPIDLSNYKWASESKPLKRNVSFMEPLYIDTFSRNEEKLIQDSIDKFTENFICIDLLEEINDQLEYEKMEDCIEYTIINRSNGIDPIEYVDKNIDTKQQSQNLLKKENLDDSINNSYTAATILEEVAAEVTRTTSDGNSNHQDLQQQSLSVLDNRSNRNGNASSILINVKITDDEDSSHHSHNSSNNAIERNPDVIYQLLDIDVPPANVDGTSITSTSISAALTMVVNISTSSKDASYHTSSQVPTATIDGSNCPTSYSSQPLSIRKVADLSLTLSPATTTTATIASDDSVISLGNHNSPLTLTTPFQANPTENIDTRIAESTDSTTTTTSYHIHETWMESALSLSPCLSLSPSPSHSPAPSSPLVYESLSDLLLHHVSSQYSIDENETAAVEVASLQNGTLNPYSASRSDSDPPVILKPVTATSASISRDFRMNEWVMANATDTNSVNHISNANTSHSSSGCSTLATLLHRRHTYNNNTTPSADVHDLWARVEQDLNNLRNKQLDADRVIDEERSMIATTDQTTALPVLLEGEAEDDVSVISVTDRENGDRSSVDFEDVRSVSGNNVESISRIYSIDNSLVMDAPPTAATNSPVVDATENHNNIEPNEWTETQILFDNASSTPSAVAMNNDQLKITNAGMLLEGGHQAVDDQLVDYSMNRSSLSDINGATTNANNMAASDPADIPLEPVVANGPLSPISPSSSMQLPPPTTNLTLSLADTIAVQKKSDDVTAEANSLQEKLDSLLVPLEGSNKLIDSSIQPLLLTGGTPTPSTGVPHQDPDSSMPLPASSSSHKSRRTMSASLSTLDALDIDTYSTRFSRSFSGLLSSLSLPSSSAPSPSPAQSVAVEAMSSTSQTLPLPSHTPAPPPQHHHHRYISTDSYFEVEQRTLSARALSELHSQSLSQSLSQSQTQSPATTAHHLTANTINSPMNSLAETEDQFDEDTDAFPTANYLIHSRFSSESLAIPRFISRTVTPEGSGGLLSRRTSRTFNAMSDNTEHDVDVDGLGVSTSASDTSSGSTSRNNSHDDIRQLIIKSLQNPSVLVGWEVYVDNLGVGQIISHSKAMFFATKFEIEFENGRTMLVALKRSQHKSGSNFTPLRKLF